MVLADRLRQGAEELGHPLDPPAVHLLLRYLEILLYWNRKINLTGIKDPEAVVVYHLLDSLSALSAFQPWEGLKLADLGSGAGCPGLVLQVAAPQIEVTLVEPSEKKVAFLHDVRGKLGINRLSIEAVRMEDLSQRFDLLMTRALSPVSVLQAAPRLLRTGGELLFFFKEKQTGPSLPEGWTLHRKIPILLPFARESRQLWVVGPGDKPASG